MKLTVLTWLRDASIGLVGRIIEFLFRLTLCILPLGLFLLLIQCRSKASAISSLSVYTKPESAWQHIFPGFILVAIDPKTLEKNFTSIKKNINTWVDINKYFLALIFAILVVVIMLFGGKY